MGYPVRKSNMKKLVVFVFLIFLFCSIIQIRQMTDPETRRDFRRIDEQIGLRSLGSWSLSSIYIDDSGGGGNGTWSWAESQPWCSGNGSIGNPYVIENITIESGGQYGIRIYLSTKYFEIRNCTIKNKQWWGIALIRTNNGRIINNSLYNNEEGITFDRSHNNLAKDNIFINNTYGFYGEGSIPADTCSNNVIDNNTFSGNTHSIHFQVLMEYNNITNNVLANNGLGNEDDYGICVQWSTGNIIFNNTITHNKGTAIYMDSAIQGGDNSVLNNKLMHNSFQGIQFAESNTVISGNYILNQTGNGIMLGMDGSLIFGNTLKDTQQNGIETGGNLLNVFYNNTFINSGVRHADDTWGNGNYWNNSVIGNYWDDYSEEDLDDDGIGDSPYQVQHRFGNSYDYKPQWRDGPTLNVSEPNQNDVFGSTPPNFTIATSDPTLDTLWYSLSLGNASYSRIIMGNGTINASDWLSLEDGNVTLRFYGNDSEGNVQFTEMNVIKDALLPNITILSPNNTAIYGSQPPGFEVILEGTDISKTWYSLFNGTQWSANITFSGLTDQINQSVWDDVGNGTVTIRFYINDSVNNIIFDEVLLLKDIIEPNITIIGSLANETFGSQPPQFNLSIFEGNLDAIWYTLDGGLTNYSCSTSGQINLTLWESLPDGTVTIRFYANDTLGNLNYLELTFEKQTEPPTGNGYLIEIILLAVLLIAVIAATLTFRKIFRGVPPTPGEKPAWIGKALGYTPELVRKLSILREQPQKFTDDVELRQFLQKPFTILPSEIITQLDRLPYADEEKIEILQTFLVLPPERRQRLLAKIIENPPQEVAS